MPRALYSVTEKVERICQKKIVPLLPDCLFKTIATHVVSVVYFFRIFHQHPYRIALSISNLFVVVIGLSVHQNQGRQCSPCCLPGYLKTDGCNNCCKRWFITFNGAECTGPFHIDAVVWNAKSDQAIHRPGLIEGYCNNTHKGRIRVGINIGNCAGYGNSNGFTGWNSVSRLVIE